VNRIVTATAVALCVATASGTGANPLAGTWEGRSRIIVSWCEQDSLSFALAVSEDGTVKGRVGDATTTEGQACRNSWFIVLLGNPDFIIEAELEGPIVEAEDITRESIKLIIDIEDDRLVGGFHTSGTKFGGPESMIMTGVDLELLRVDEPEP